MVDRYQCFEIKYSPPSSEKMKEMGALDFSDYFVHSFTIYCMYRVKKFRSFYFHSMLGCTECTNVYDVFRVLIVCIFASISLFFKWETLSGKNVFRWSPFYLCQCMCLSPNQALTIWTNFTTLVMYVKTLAVTPTAYTLISNQ